MRRMNLAVPQSHWTLFTTVMIFSLLGYHMGSPLPAEAKDSFRVAVIDPHAVMEKSKSGSRALALLKEHAQARDNVLKSDQKELERLQEEIKKAEGTLPEKEVKQKREVFARKFQDYQKRGQEYQAELAQKQREMVQEYMKKIEDVTSVVAKRHGFSLVVDMGSENTLKIVLYSRKGLDITNEVVKEFDRRYK